MKSIPLTRGQCALVDDEDFEYLNQWKWYALKSGNTFYAKTNGGVRNNKRIHLQMHRIIMNPPDHLFIDHINHNGLDNRKENLRIVTNRENHFNRSDQGEYIGVSKHKNKYRAQLRFKHKRIHLGLFETPEEAQLAYINAAKYYDELSMR